MNAGRIILSGIAGTTFMTLFSYLVSGKKGKNFKEPQLLGALEKDLLPGKLTEFALPVGWATHYSVGVAWSVTYHFLWQKDIVRPTVKNGLLLGGVSGLTGVMFWAAFFKIHSNPPRIDFNGFYRHLVLAHLVYGTAVTISGRNNS